MVTVLLLQLPPALGAVALLETSGQVNEVFQQMCDYVTPLPE